MNKLLFSLLILTSSLAHADAVKYEYCPMSGDAALFTTLDNLDSRTIYNALLVPETTLPDGKTQKIFESAWYPYGTTTICTVKSSSEAMCSFRIYFIDSDTHVTINQTKLIASFTANGQKAIDHNIAFLSEATKTFKFTSSDGILKIESKPSLFQIDFQGTVQNTKVLCHYNP